MKWITRIAIFCFVLLAALAVAPLFVSFDGYIPQIEQEISAKLKEPVKIKSLRVAALPLPHVTIDGIMIGKSGDVTVGKIAVTPDLWSLLGSPKVIRGIRIDSLILTQKAIDKIPLWTGSAGDKASHPQIIIEKIHVDDAQVRLDAGTLGPFDARVSLNARGGPEDASITTKDGKLKVLIKPDKSNYLINASAKSWKLPVGPAILFDELAVQGVATLNDVNLSKVNGRLYGGTVGGKASIGWRKGLQLKGNLDISRVELKSLVPLLAPGKRMSGMLSAAPVFSASAPSAKQFANALRLETPFNVQSGVLYGVDVEKAATSLIKQGASGGETRFDQLSGHLVMERGNYRFTQLQIASGALAASGNVSISPKKELSGRINAEIKAATLASASVPLNVSGTLDSPLLLPTGASVAGAAVGTAVLGPGLGTSVGAKVGNWAEGLFGRKEEK